MRAFAALHLAVDQLAGASINRADLQAEFDRASNAELLSEMGYRPGAPGSAERRAYRSQMRNLQRYRKGRQPGPKITALLRARLASRGTRATLERIRRRGVTADFGGIVYVSEDERYRAPGPVWIESDELLDQAIDEALKGHWGRAADIFAEAWGVGYGIGSVGWGDVDFLTLTWGR